MSDDAVERTGKRSPNKTASGVVKTGSKPNETVDVEEAESLWNLVASDADANQYVRAHAQCVKVTSQLV